MESKNNMPVRDCARIANVPMYKVADLMGISESTLTKKMRYEWPPEEQRRVIQLIEQYASGKEPGNE
ncbi:MAG: hypothetical protein IJH98_06545 [Solobacterium sp.]|nr:hypothetical protein [Solobacterium sp.]